MKWHEDVAAGDPELVQALKHFKASMDAWSDAGLSLPRTVAKTDARRVWRFAASWALGCVLAAGSLTIAVHEFVHSKAAAGQTAQKTMQKEPAAAQAAGAQAQNRAPAPAADWQKAGAQDEDLLASVDKDVSEQVPAALEPLAQLMDDSAAR